jgi:hypothetical protein
MKIVDEGIVEPHPRSFAEFRDNEDSRCSVRQSIGQAGSY